MSSPLTNPNWPFKEAPYPYNPPEDGEVLNKAMEEVYRAMENTPMSTGEKAIAYSNAYKRARERREGIRDACNTKPELSQIDAMQELHNLLTPNQWCPVIVLEEEMWFTIGPKSWVTLRLCYQPQEGWYIQYTDKDSLSKSSVKGPSEGREEFKRRGELVAHEVFLINRAAYEVQQKAKRKIETLKSAPNRAPYWPCTCSRCTRKRLLHSFYSFLFNK